MECLVVGDVHLTDSDGGGSTGWAVPEYWSEYELLLLVGDLLDRSARSTEPAESFLDAVDALDVPAFVVPGNHDYHIFECLSRGYNSITNLDGTYESIGDWSFYGLGSDQFNDGPEVRYPHWDSLSNESPEHVESTVRSLAGGEFDQDVPGSAELYTRRERQLASLAADCQTTRSVLLSHLPPLGSGVDTIGGQRHRYSGYPWGSISVRTHIRRAAPELVACGHIHEASGVERLGETVCVNPGLRSTHTVRLTDEGVQSRPD
jgi:Icc-related predicted phosphoesterase